MAHFNCLFGCLSDKDLNPHCSAYTLIPLGSTVVPSGSCAEIFCESSASLTTQFQ